MNGALFTDWVETQLAPVLAPGTVVILDKPSTHKVAPAAEALRRAGCWFLFLPAYSPDRSGAFAAPLGPRSPSPYRDGLRQAQSSSPADRCQDDRRRLGYHRHDLPHLHPKRMPQLPPTRRLCSRIMIRRFRRE
ncbi:transposase [Jannaschia seohaensis]|uniref:transposase n=1 Tax=Jannaschia seohaensis TaxID=475081 RepID=UPI00387E701C